jgi:hypothetical protein
MIGALTVGQFIVLVLFSFGLLALFWKAIADARKLDARKTVEQEQEESRAPLKLAGQHHPSCGKIEDDDAEPFSLDTIDDRDNFLRRFGIGNGL